VILIRLAASKRFEDVGMDVFWALGRAGAFCDGVADIDAGRADAARAGFVLGSAADAASVLAAAIHGVVKGFRRRVAPAPACTA